MKELLKPILITAAVVVVTLYLVNNFFPATFRDKLLAPRPAA